MREQGLSIFLEELHKYIYIYKEDHLPLFFISLGGTYSACNAVTILPLGNNDRSRCLASEVFPPRQ